MAGGGEVSPPGWAEMLLGHWLPAAVRDDVLGDLAEYYRGLAARSGRRVARRWYLRQTLRALNPLTRARLGRLGGEWVAASTRPWRQEGRGELMGSIVRDAGHAVRMLRRSPGFALAVVVTLALGIGANTAIYSVVDAVVLEPLPFDAPAELALVYTENPTEGHERYYVSPLEFLDWRRLSERFEELAAFWPTTVTQKELDGGPRQLRAVYTTPNFYSMLGVAPLLGRVHGAGEGAGSPPRLILGHGFWQREFGGDPGVVGRTVQLDFGPAEVIGVLPAGAGYPASADVWLNITWPMEIQTRHARWMTVLARLADDATIAQAREEMLAVTRQVAETYPDTNRGWSASVVPLEESVLGDARRALLVLLAATGLILLIACANIGGLLLSRAESRSREMSLRTALGASRSRLTRQLLTESLMLAGVGAAAGLVLALGGLRLLQAVAPPELPRADEIALDGSVLLFLAATALAAGLLFGLWPVVRLLTSDPAPALRSARTGADRAGTRIQKGLVVAQVALAVVLVVGAGLLTRSLAALLEVDTGFRTSGLLTFDVHLPNTRYDVYDDPGDLVRFYDRFLDRLESLPGVAAAGAATSLPLRESYDYFQPFWPASRAYDPTAVSRAWFREVSPGFFSTMGIPVVAGRSFTERDGLETPGVAVINETMARRYFPDRDPIGERIGGLRGGYGPLGFVTIEEAEVVGVVRDVRYGELREAAEPALYLSYRQAPFGRMTVALRASGDPGSLVPAVRRELAELDPGLPVANVATIEELVSRSLARDRFSTLLLGLFSLLALALAAVGIYGVLAYVVQQRHREIGIRMALGASRARVRRMVLTDGGRLLLPGLALGLLAALAATRLLASQLFDVSARDPVVFTAVAALLAAVGVGASYVPALRATRTDPAAAMRAE